MKTKHKYEDVVMEPSSDESQSEDDEDGCKLTEEVEKKFYETLSKIKSKDPKIYQKDVDFFKDVPILETKAKKSSKSNPLTLRDYERRFIIEKGGEFSDEEQDSKNCKAEEEPTYVQEQESLKKSLKSFIDDDSGNEEDAWGGLFQKRSKNKVDQKEEDESYREWLKGQKNLVDDEEAGENMKSLRDYWTNPELNEGDKFLRDYVLNKKYLENDDDDDQERSLEDPNSDSEDDDQSNIKHRFEEADQEYIKRYPRVMENSLRRKNDHRKLKREEVKERKKKEKQKKRAEVKQKQKLKRKEIEEKLEELKKITGNDRLAFDDILNKDFDMDEHDQAMQKLFNDEFYSQDDPNFLPTEGGDAEEEEGEWNEELNEENVEQPVEQNEVEINCEDPNFNMDCDYDPSLEKPKESKSRSRRRKDKHRRTTLSEAVNKEKPTFDPSTHKTFQEYVDQYYAIDCEDFIGDLPCRFKYRNTVPNSYGLTIEEILAADEKELERWCSIKRIHQLRPEHKEKCDLKVYKKKAADEELKRKILPSLYKKKSDEDVDSKDEKESTVTATTETENMSNKNVTKSKKKKKKRKVKDTTEVNNTNVESTSKNKSKSKKIISETNSNQSETKTNRPKDKTKEFNKKRKLETETNNEKNNKRFKPSNNPKTERKHQKSRKLQKPTEESSLTSMTDARLMAYGIKPKKFRNKLKYNADV